MSLSDPLVITVAVLGGLVGVLVVVTVVLALRLRRLAADQRRALDGVEVDVIATLARQRRRLDELDEAVTAAQAHSESVAQHVRRTVSRIGVVRYDAFDDIGGQHSFSAALLDEHSDGVVLTSITGRSDGRTYLKSVTAGVGSIPLSDEESAAIDAARQETRSERVVEQGKRSWRQRDGSSR
jgi:uncharacterized coiled-coil protein SlyX